MSGRSPPLYCTHTLIAMQGLNPYLISCNIISIISTIICHAAYVNQSHYGSSRTVRTGVLAHPLDWLSTLDCSTTTRVPMPKRAVFERSRRELSLDVSVGVHILLVVEQSSLESQSRGCAKTPTLTSTVIARVM